MEKEKEISETETTGSYKHTWWKIALIVGFVPAIAIAAAVSSVGQALGILDKDIGDNSDLYYLALTPSSSTFAIWGVIWPWQVVWFVYVFIAIFRKTPKEYLYQHPAFPALVYPLNIVSYLTSTGWTITFDKDLLGWAFAMLFAMPVVLFVALGISCKRLHDNEEELHKIGNTKDVWLIRGLIQNGIAFYGTWVLIASLLNLGMLIVYRWNGSQELASMVVLGLLSFVLIVAYFADNLFLYRYTQFIVSPFVVLIVALRGVLVKSWDMENREPLTIFTLTLLVCVSVGLLIKLIVIFVRMYKSRSQKTASINSV